MFLVSVNSEMAVLVSNFKLIPTLNKVKKLDLKLEKLIDEGCLIAFNSENTVNPLYNNIRYNSKIRYYIKLVSTKVSGSCIFSLLFPCYSSGKHTFYVIVRNALARRF